MRRNKRKTTKMSLLMMLLLLGIGFAALTANLKINGTVDVSKASWDVHFENVSITEGSVTANPAPTSDDETTTEMTYAVNFTKPGDFYEFTVDIVNDGTIDAMVDSVSNNAYADSESTTPIELPSYLESYICYVTERNYCIEYRKNDFLEHNKSHKIKVRIEFKKDIETSDLPREEDTSLVFKFNANYKQADENANYDLMTKIYKKEETNEVCLYIKNFSSEELCLKDGEVEVSTKKIKDFFGFDENTWTKTERDDEDPSGEVYHYDDWKNPTNELTSCSRNYHDEKFYCAYGIFGNRIFIGTDSYDNGKSRVYIYNKLINGNSIKESISTR